MAATCQWILRMRYGVAERCVALAMPGGEYCALHRYGEPRRRASAKVRRELTRDVLPWTGTDEAAFERLTRKRE